MGTPYSENNSYIRHALASGIPQSLLNWRKKMGFPVHHLAATELVGDTYLHGTFEQGDYPDKKTLKIAVVGTIVPRPAPDIVPVTYKRKKLSSHKLAKKI